MSILHNLIFKHQNSQKLSYFYILSEPEPHQSDGSGSATLIYSHGENVPVRWQCVREIQYKEEESWILTHLVPRICSEQHYFAGSHTGTGSGQNSINSDLDPLLSLKNLQEQKKIWIFLTQKLWMITTFSNFLMTILCTNTQVVKSGSNLLSRTLIWHNSDPNPKT